MIDQKLAIITVHDVNPSHSEEILTVKEQLNKLKVKYNLSIVPYYNKKYRLEDYMDFCKQISSLLKEVHVELTLHGLYHEADGKIEDFDTESKDKEKNKQTLKQNKEMFYGRLFNVNGKTNGLYRMAIHPPHDPDGALQDQVEMIKYIKEKEGYELIKYSDLPRIESISTD